VHSGLQFGVRQLEEHRSLARCKAFRHLKPFRRDSFTSVTDDQTDRHYYSKCRAKLRCATKTATDWIFVKLLREIYL